MNIRYVVSTMVFWWREHHLSFEQECEFLRSLGFGVEIWPTMKGNDECRYGRKNWPRLQLATEGMTVSLHSRQDGPTLKEWDEQLQCSKLLNSWMITDLSSLCVAENLSIADWGFASDVVKMAEQYDVKLCVQNGHLPSLLEVGRRFDSVHYCFDTGHAFLNEQYGFNEHVDRMAERVSYVHLTDNYGQLDDHEPPGVRGGMPKNNWDYLRNALSKYNNELIGSLQMIPCLPGTMIRQSSKFLFDVMGWPNKPVAQPGVDETFYRPV